jgi:hypothetical protein
MSYREDALTDTDYFRAALAVENRKRLDGGLPAVAYDQMSPEECSRVARCAQELKAAAQKPSRSSQIA